MKNIVENQGIKTDKPLAMSYEALKAERDAQQKRADALAVESAGFKHALSVILEHVDVTDKGQAGVVAMISRSTRKSTSPPCWQSWKRRMKRCGSLRFVFLREATTLTASMLRCLSKR